MSNEDTIMSGDLIHPIGYDLLPSPERVDPLDVTYEPPDLSRRHALVAVTTVLGGIGAAVATVPFIASMLPSERAKVAGAPVEVDISKLEPGTLLTVEWQGKPAWILRRTDKMLQLLGANDRRLNDPQSKVPQQPAYCENPTRSIKAEYLVSVGLCTHLGCVPTFRPEIAPADLGPEWHGGFFCPCHGSKFDLAGRVYKGVPAPTNLVIPRHIYSNDFQLIIGTDVK